MPTSPHYFRFGDLALWLDGSMRFEVPQSVCPREQILRIFSCQVGYSPEFKARAAATAGMCFVLEGIATKKGPLV